jgi:hypothetical protein
VNLVKGPSPAGQLFAESAAAIKPMEACALLLGRLIDEARAMTMLPLSAENREIVIAALRMLSQFDSVAPTSNTGCAR